MPRYFFHLRDGTDVLLDPEGRQIDDPAAIPALALLEARSLISHDALGGLIDLNQRIEVEDARGQVVCRVELSEAIEIALRADKRRALVFRPA